MTKNEKLAHELVSLIVPADMALRKAVDLARAHIGNPSFNEALRAELLASGHQPDDADDLIKTYIGLVRQLNLH